MSNDHTTAIGVITLKWHPDDNEAFDLNLRSKGVEVGIEACFGDHLGVHTISDYVDIDIDKDGHTFSPNSACKFEGTPMTIASTLWAAMTRTPALNYASLILAMQEVLAANTEYTSPERLHPRHAKAIGTVSEPPDLSGVAADLAAALQKLHALKRGAK